MPNAMMAAMQRAHGARDPKSRTIPYGNPTQMDRTASLDMVGAAMTVVEPSLVQFPETPCFGPDASDKPARTRWKALRGSADEITEAAGPTSELRTRGTD